MGNGEGRVKSRTVEPGSPEHNLLTEAGVISPKVGLRVGLNKAGMRGGSSNWRSEDQTPAREGNGKMAREWSSG